MEKEHIQCCEHCHSSESKQTHTFYGFMVCKTCYISLKEEEIKKFEKWKQNEK